MGEMRHNILVVNWPLGSHKATLLYKLDIFIIILDIHNVEPDEVLEKKKTF